MTKKEVRFCPACSMYYAERPAVSRKDPNILICPDCGTREALEAASFSGLFGPTFKAFAEARRKAECSPSL